MSRLKHLNQKFISNLKTHELLTIEKRNLILSILKSTTTKREAKNYLNKYQKQFNFESFSLRGSKETKNLTTRDGQWELFVDRFLNSQNPFRNVYEGHTRLDKVPLRIGIFRLKFHSILRNTWKGIAETLHRLVKLGIAPIIALDYDHLPTDTFKHNELYMISQANKVLSLLGKPYETGTLNTTVLRSLFNKEGGKSTKDRASINLELLLIPLYQGKIPIIQPIVYNTSDCSQSFIKSNELLTCLCSSLLERRDLLSIEKVVMIEPKGGVPSIERNRTSHVFINLNQEYSEIVSELYIGFIKPSERDLHLNNLNTMNRILTLVSDKMDNDEATGIITTPEICSINDDQLNPIIYNVLTDRAVISSSLPLSHKSTPELSTSIIKKGVDVTVLNADDYSRPFTLKNLIQDGFIDEARFINLINDSFGKPLDRDGYFARVNDTLATIVIVGDYDGAAIITWEHASPSNNDSSNERIAYLDKFAIATRNQGLPGLADIIFKIILQSHPKQLIWRSRKENPVNKWYFERSCGTLSIPTSQWRLFYTGTIFSKKIDKVKRTNSAGVDIGKKLNDFSRVIENIPPSFI